MSKAITKQTVINGVDVTRLGETVDAVKAQPELASFKFRASNQWLTGGHNRSAIKGFYGVGAEDVSRTASFVLDADEPDVLLGTDRGANPVEYLLHALAACMPTTLVYHAAARGITIESVESRFEGDLDLQGFLGLNETVRPGYQNIRASFKVKADADAEDLQDLFEYSPVRNTILQPVNIDASVAVLQS